MNIKRNIVLFSFAAVSFLILTSSLAWADFGSITIPPTSVYTPGQKAIIVWNGTEEVLILSIDSHSVAELPLLRILPLPSAPSKIEAADTEFFYIIDDLIRDHAPPDTSSFRDEIVFHTIIGAHDITVAQAGDIETFDEWLEAYLTENGLENVSLPELQSMITEYIDDGITYFVFDLTTVNDSVKSIEPILYRFKTSRLWFPLKNTRLSEGETHIKLFVITEEELPSPLAGLEVDRYLDPKETPVSFPLSLSELRADFPNIAELLGRVSGERVPLFILNLWFTALTYDGAVGDLTEDLNYSPCGEIADPPDKFGGKVINTTPLASSNDNVKIKVTIGTATPCYGVAFGGVERIGNRLEAQIVIYPPDPGQICPQYAPTYEHIYDCGKLEAGDYSFTVTSYMCTRGYYHYPCMCKTPTGTKTITLNVVQYYAPSLEIIEPTKGCPAVTDLHTDSKPITVLLDAYFPYFLIVEEKIYKPVFRPNPRYVIQVSAPFEILIGGKEAKILSIKWMGDSEEGPMPPGGRYGLEVLPPPQGQQGFYDLEVKFNPREFWGVTVSPDYMPLPILTDKEEDIVHYGQLTEGHVIFTGTVKTKEQCKVVPVCYGQYLGTWYIPGITSMPAIYHSGLGAFDSSTPWGSGLYNLYYNIAGSTTTSTGFPCYQSPLTFQGLQWTQPYSGYHPIISNQFTATSTSFPMPSVGQFLSASIVPALSYPYNIPAHSDH